MNRYDLAIFDLDGTLLDTTQGVVAAYKHTINRLGLPMIGDDELKSFIGPPVQEAFARRYGMEGEVLQELAGIFRDFYSTVTLFEAEAYDGIYTLFETFCKRGIKPSVATYKREDYALRLLKHFEFDKYTDIMFGGDHENKLKKKDIIEKCIAASGVNDKRKIVMIGDTISDAVGAELVGIDFIGVTYGFGFKTEEDRKDVKAQGFADSVPNLLKFF